MILAPQLVSQSNSQTPATPESYAMVQQSFYVALLLTGKLASAECAVLQAIESSDPKDMETKALVYRAVKASILLSKDSFERKRTDVGDDLLTLLPIELERILYMDTPLRQCYVLRVLLGFSGSECAEALGLDIDTVATTTCAAAEWLAHEAQGSAEVKPRLT